MVQKSRIKVIVLDSVGRTQQMDMFKSFNVTEGRNLYFERERRRKALEIILGRVTPFGLKKKLVRILVSEGAELISVLGQ